MLKSIGDFIFSLFGLDQWSKSDEAEGMKESVNDICDTLKISHVFQTKKDKEEAERKALAEQRRNIAETAENMKEITRLLGDISKKL